MSSPKLIITADDYGMSPRFNQGILDLTREHIVTGISVMILRKYIRAQELLALQVPLGLHLEFKKNALEKDIHVQIIRFQKRFGILPAYLDGHQHQHLAPGNLERVLHVAKKYKLPVRSRLPEERSLFKRHRVGSPDYFISWHPSRIAVLKKKLQEAQNFTISELVVHPGYYDKNCAYPYNQQREEEIHFLRSPRFKKLLQSFQLAQYPNLSKKNL